MLAPSYDYRQVPTIRDFSNSDAFIRGLMGPLGGGKSTGCVMEIMSRGIAQRPSQDGVRRSRWAVVRNSYRQLEDSTIRTVLQWFPPQIYGHWVPTNHNYIIKSLHAAADEPAAEIEICFRALDRPDQIGNLLSTEYTGAWINEGRDVPWAVWEAMMGRVGRYPAMKDGGPSWFGIFADTNPPDADSRWHKFFEDDDHTDAIEAMNAEIDRQGLKIPHYTKNTYSRIFKQPSGLGPDAENVPNLIPLYYARQQAGKTDDWIKVYLRGEYGFTVDGKPVFPEYSDSVHCPEDKRLWPKLLPDETLYVSFDFGLTPAAVFSQVSSTGRWLVIDELVSYDINVDGMGFDQFSDVVLTHIRRYYSGMAVEFIGDPAGNQRGQADEKTCFQIGAVKGIHIQPAPQTLQIRLEGARWPMSRMVNGQPRFLLHPNCKRLRKALLGGYHYRRMQVSAERYGDKPDKNEHSHVADAFTYAGAWLFGAQLTQRPIEEEARPNAMADRTRSNITGY